MKWFSRKAPEQSFVSGLSRRNFLVAALAAPVIIRTSGLLMPVKAGKVAFAPFEGWFKGITPLLPGEGFVADLAMVAQIDDFLDAVHAEILAGDGKLPDMLAFSDHPAMVVLV